VSIFVSRGFNFSSQASTAIFDSPTSPHSEGRVGKGKVVGRNRFSQPNVSTAAAAKPAAAEPAAAEPAAAEPAAAEPAAAEPAKLYYQSLHPQQMNSQQLQLHTCIFSSCTCILAAASYNS
jgi:hypothetical protein